MNNERNSDVKKQNMRPIKKLFIDVSISICKHFTSAFFFYFSIKILKHFTKYSRRFFTYAFSSLCVVFLINYSTHVIKESYGIYVEKIIN